MECQTISLGKITVPPSHRTVKPASVAALAASILEIGLCSPIGLVRDGGGYRLIHGRHRLEALRSLGRLEIDAVIFDLDDLHCELAEIDENLQRHNLNKMQEAKALKRRKAIYLELHPETRNPNVRGGPGRGKKTNDNVSPVSSFTSDTATKTGRSRRSVERDVAIGEAICDEAAKIIDDTPIADNRSELAALGAMEPEEQIKAAEKVRSGKARSVKPRKTKGDGPSFCGDLDALIEKHHAKHKTPWCIICSVLEHKLEWAKEQQD